MNIIYQFSQSGKWCLWGKASLGINQVLDMRATNIQEN